MSDAFVLETISSDSIEINSPDFGRTDGESVAAFDGADEWLFLMKTTHLFSRSRSD